MDSLIRFTADGVLIFIIVIGTALGMRGINWRQWRVVVPFGIMAGMTSLLAGKLLSLVYQPSSLRPFMEYGAQAGAAYIDNPGFPSDHMLLATVITIAVYFMTPYKKTAVILMVLACVMGVARVAALVHTPLDIVGGIVAGLAGAIWYIQMKGSNNSIEQ